MIQMFLRLKINKFHICQTVISNSQCRRQFRTEFGKGNVHFIQLIAYEFDIKSNCYWN